MRISLLAMAIVFALASCTKKPVADFEVSLNENKLRTVVMENKSVGAENYMWNFGDGTASQEISPEHTYKKDGTYSIVLMAKNNGKVSAKTRSMVIDLQNTESKVTNYITATFTEPDFDFQSDSAVLVEEANKLIYTAYMTIDQDIRTIEMALPLNPTLKEYEISNQYYIKRTINNYTVYYNSQTIWEGGIKFEKMSGDTVWGSFYAEHYDLDYGEIKNGTFKYVNQ